MALHAAARNGDVAALRAAIAAAGSDLDVKDNLARTPLHLAAWAGQTEVLRLLIAHGCTVTAAALDDCNALHFAAQKGHVEAVRQLLTAGIHVNSRTRKGMTALAMAAQNGHVGVVELLLKRKASPSATNTKGQTPLELAKVEEVKALLHAAIAEGGAEGAAPEAGEGAWGVGLQRPKKLRGAQKGGQMKMPVAPEPTGQPKAEPGDEASEAVMIGPALGPMATTQTTKEEEAGEGVMIGPALGPTVAAAAVEGEQPEQPPPDSTAEAGTPAPEVATAMGTDAAAAHDNGKGAGGRDPFQEPAGKKQKVILSFGDEDD